MKKREGLSLIEVILSMALLSLVSIIVLNLFGFNLKNIKSSGDRTFKIVDLENRINDEIIKSEEDGDEIIINIGGVERKVKGKIIKLNDNGKTITTFVPSKNGD